MERPGPDFRPPPPVPGSAASPPFRRARATSSVTRRGLVAAVVAVAWALPATPAGAHAVPAAMEPPPNARLDRAPGEVVIRFTERVEARPSSLEVLDARGQRVEQGAAAVVPGDPWRYRVALPALPDGVYTVAWRVLSADDGHVTSGAHVFTVGAAGAPGGESAPTLRSGVGGRPFARWLVGLGGALLLGALVAGPLLGLGGLGGMIVLGGIAVAAGATLDLALQARDLAGERPLAGVLAALLLSPPGYAGLARIGLVALLLGLLGLRGSRARAGDGRARVGALVAMAIVATGGLVSHGAAAAEGRALALGAEALHLLAMASWVGGLLCFATVYWRAGAAGTADPETERLVVAIPTFSRLAVFAVAIIGVSGLLLARLHLSAWSELLDTTYGRWVGAKVAVFLAMMGLGAWHQWGVESRLRRALARGLAGSGAVSLFRRTVRIEAALGLAALGLAGALGVTAPPSGSSSAGVVETPAAAPAGFTHERALDAARIRLEITPVRPGPNAIRLTVTDPAGRPLADATAALVQVTPADASVGAVSFQLDRAAPGVFTAPSAVLGFAGRWSGRLVVQRTNAYDVNDRFDLVVAEGVSDHAHVHAAAPAVAATAPRRGTPLDRATVSVALAAAVASLVLFLRSGRQLDAARRLVSDNPQPPASAPARR